MKNLFTLLFLVFGISANAQTQFELNGFLKSNEDQIIANVKVTNKRTLQTTFSNETGIFTILTQKNDTISFFHKDYFNQIVIAKNDDILNVRMFLTSINSYNLENIIISSTRVADDSPFTSSTISKEKLQKSNLGQDLPILINQLTNVVTTSDAGAGVGYTGIRVRGSDATRVNVTINGIPLNDSESQGTYWVNIPDLASSVSSIQLQRGVGTSTNGTGAFGASLNLSTDGINTKPSLVFNNSFGSFNTRKHTIGIQSGKVKEHFSFQGKFSKINSDGYIDRASSDLNSYYTSATYLNGKTLIKALAFGGHEKTYQSWNGVDPATMESDRTSNSAGAVYDDEYNVLDYYDNEVDDYRQNHYQLHANQQLSSNWNANLSFHYTKGAGYYEQYKQNKSVESYGLTPTITANDTINKTDLISRKWLDNDFYGFATAFKYDSFKKLSGIIGGTWNRYDGDHFGEVIWARNAGSGNIRDRFYDNNGLKDDLSVFAKGNYEINDKITLFADVQIRNVKYKTTDFLENDVDENLTFFNPKAGLTYQLDKLQFYYSYARANKEPNRSDYEYAVTPPKSEQLDDHELGWRYSTNNFQFNSNIYFMNYTNQLVLTGAVDDEGDFIRTNIGKSNRMGIELSAGYRILQNLIWSPNISLSQNKNLDYKIAGDSTSLSLGDTDISYSPNIVFGNDLEYSIHNFSVGLATKYVGSQYLSNENISESKLDGYLVNDLRLGYHFKALKLKALINNIANTKYESNGYMWGTTPYLFPQAGINFLVGLEITIQ